jgi:large subunit ribosomal protein L15e
MRRPRPRAGRRPKALGTVKRRVGVDVVGVAINRARKRYPNLKALGGYLLYEDGKYKYVEVILVDPHHPRIRADKDVAKRL